MKMDMYNMEWFYKHETTKHKEEEKKEEKDN